VVESVHEPVGAVAGRSIRTSPERCWDDVG
jgi:hypothetical protein